MASMAAFAADSGLVVRTGRLADWSKVPGCAPLERAFRYLETTSFEGKAPGRFEIDGDRMYAMLSEAPARALQSAAFEAHRNYIDIHYLLAGKELIGAASAKKLRVKTPYDSSKEVEMYETPREYQRIVLQPGHFAVFYPGEAHMPNCDAGGGGNIRKVVVKILHKA